VHVYLAGNVSAAGSKCNQSIFNQSVITYWMENSKSSRILKIDITLVIDVKNETNMLADEKLLNNQNLFH